MVITCVTIYVKKEFIPDFIEATLDNHRNSIEEEENIRFDVLRCNSDETRFFLYEAYSSEEASAAHKKTTHYLKWRNTVADWMAQARVGVTHSVVAPLEKYFW